MRHDEVHRELLCFAKARVVAESLSLASEDAVLDVGGLMALVVCHTSDWHLGRTLHGASFDRAHASFLRWLVDTIVARSVDVLLVAGDVFDRSVPSAQAEELFYGFLADVRSRSAKTKVVVIAGNHDGPTRLAAPSPVLVRMGVRVFGSLPDLRTMSGQEGAVDRLEERLVRIESGADKLVIAALPFLRPSDLSQVALDEGSTADDTFEERTRVVYAHAAKLALKDGPVALIAMGHAHARGARLSPDSERTLAFGDAAQLGAEVFPIEAQYVALGHLHFAQAVAPASGRNIRYSGSPLPLAFSEHGYPHQVALVHVEETTVRGIETVLIPPFIDLVRIDDEGRALPLDRALEALRERARSEASKSETRETWVQVRVRVEGARPALRKELADALVAAPHLKLVHVDVTRTFVGNQDAEGLLEGRGFTDVLAPHAVLTRAWRALSEEPVPEGVVRALDAAWAEAVREDEAESASRERAESLEVTQPEGAS